MGLWTDQKAPSRNIRRLGPGCLPRGTRIKKGLPVSRLPGCAGGPYFELLSHCFATSEAGRSQSCALAVVVVMMDVASCFVSSHCGSVALLSYRMTSR